jgi:hypothetical protein
MQFTEKRLRVKWYGGLDVTCRATAFQAPVLEHCVDQAFGIDTTPGLPGDSNRRRML